jgi:hypothetical protein
MKNKVLVITIVFFSLLNLKVNAQIKIGGSLGYATEIKNIGLTLHGNYAINDQWEAAPSFSYYFKKDYTSYWSIDLAGHYVFNTMDKYSFYGLGGFEILGVKVKIPASSETLYGVTVSTPEYTGTDSQFGIVLGGGARMSINDKLSGFAELKLGILDDTYIGLNFGILYSLN